LKLLHPRWWWHWRPCPMSKVWHCRPHSWCSPPASKWRWHCHCTPPRPCPAEVRHKALQKSRGQIAFANQCLHQWTWVTRLCSRWFQHPGLMSLAGSVMLVRLPPERLGNCGIDASPLTGAHNALARFMSRSDCCFRRRVAILSAPRQPALLETHRRVECLILQAIDVDRIATNWMKDEASHERRLETERPGPVSVQTSSPPLPSNPPIAWRVRLRFLWWSLLQHPWPRI